MTRKQILNLTMITVATTTNSQCIVFGYDIYICFTDVVSKLDWNCKVAKKFFVSTTVSTFVYIIDGSKSDADQHCCRQE